MACRRLGRRRRFLVCAAIRSLEQWPTNRAGWGLYPCFQRGVLTHASKGMGLLGHTEGVVPIGPQRF